MRERKCWGDKRPNGNEDNNTYNTYFHAMLKNLNFTLLLQRTNEKKKKNVCIYHIINITNNTRKKVCKAGEHWRPTCLSQAANAEILEVTSITEPLTEHFKWSHLNKTGFVWRL